MTTMVVGNGESRNLLNLELFSKDYDIIGCNAICREAHIDKLVCVDRRMLEESVNHPNTKNTKIYTREDYVPYYNGIGYKNVQCVPDIPYEPVQKQDEAFHWGSGPYAILIGALTSEESTVILAGFDLYSKDGKINNIYKGTQNYNRADSNAVDPSYWIHQVGKVFECFPEKDFLIFQEPDWQLPAQWNFDNVRVENIK